MTPTPTSVRRGMTGLREHRQLLSAAKALLNRLEVRGADPFRPMQQADWVVVVKANYAIAESKDVLEFAGNSRKPIHRI